MKLILEDLTFQYQTTRHSGKKIFNEFSFSFQQDSLCILTGCNGTGKSTMLELIAGLKKGHSGRVVLAGSDGIGRIPLLEDISYFTQFYENLFFSDNVKAELLQTINYSNSSLTYLDLCGYYNALGLDLTAIEEYSPFALNSGSQKILSLILALVKDSPVILLDEIEASLSLATKLKLADFLQEMKKNRIIICVSHDSMFINKVADRILLLKEGEDFQSFESSSAYFCSREFAGIDKENLDIQINKDQYLYGALS